MGCANFKEMRQQNHISFYVLYSNKNKQESNDTLIKEQKEKIKETKKGKEMKNGSSPTMYSLKL